MSRDSRPEERQVPKRTDHQPRVIFGIFEFNDMFVVLANQRWFGRWLGRWFSWLLLG